VIELIHIQLTFASRVILNIPHLSFEDGKRYALVGVNGSGKTTLLRIIAGILKPDGGEIKGLPAGMMGYMPQSPYAFGFTVQKNVEMALPNSPNAAKQAYEALSAVGMSGLADAHGNKLSGGETERMAFARMIALPRKLLVLDEPLSSADIQGTDQIEATLLSYVAETGCTLILSTHSPAQALRLAEETIFLDQGEIIEQGLSKDVLKNPQSERARFFLQHWKI
jgi:tungstate transport system ATP-binding protein